MLHIASMLQCKGLTRQKQQAQQVISGKQRPAESSLISVLHTAHVVLLARTE